MNDDWLTGGMRSLVTRAVAEAARRGTSTVEAEHVLLALLADGSSDVARAVAASGLDHGSLDAALDLERTKSLAAAGVAPIDPALLVSTPRAAKPSWGASVVAARARAAASAAARAKSHASHGRTAARISAGSRAQARGVDIAAAIVSAPIGTVARALAYAGFDRTDLLRRLRESSAGELDAGEPNSGAPNAGAPNADAPSAGDSQSAGELSAGDSHSAGEPNA